MKIWTFFILIAGFSVPAPAASPAAVLRRPLIVGASISAGTLTPGPGTRAALRYTTADQIRNQAVAGSYGRDLQGFHVDYFRTRTVVIGVDFLFWDGTLPDEKPSLRTLEKLVATAGAAGVPVLIGDVPALSPWPYQMRCRDKLNRSIRAICRPARGCHVLGFERMYERLRTRPVHYGDADYSWPALSIDGLHLNETGSEYMADLIVAAIRRM